MPDRRTAANPNSTLDPSEHASANARAVPSIDISASRGRVAGPCVTSTRRPIEASTMPRAPPRTPSVRLSTSSSRAILPQPAPSAPRIANSCRRDCARTSTRFATFAQTSKSTSPSAPMRNLRTEPTSPTTSFFSGCRLGWTLSISSILPTPAVSPQVFQTRVTS